MFQCGEEQGAFGKNKIKIFKWMTSFTKCSFPWWLQGYKWRNKLKMEWTPESQSETMNFGRILQVAGNLAWNKLESFFKQRKLWGKMTFSDHIFIELCWLFDGESDLETLCSPTISRIVAYGFASMNWLAWQLQHLYSGSAAVEDLSDLCTSGLTLRCAQWTVRRQTCGLVRV